MTHVRAVLKILLLFLFNLAIYTGYFFVYAILRLLKARIEPWRNVCMRGWAKGAGFILNMRITIKGTPPLPPFFLVSNHLSYIDIIPLYRNLKCTFVAKKEVRSWPVLGFMVKTMGVIFVDRTRKRDVTRVNEELSKKLNQHQGIVLFPEGTTSAGTHVLPFQPSLLEIPANSRIPVHYASVHYQTHEKDIPAHESVCWYGGISFFGHIYKLASNRRIICTMTFGEKTVQNSDRKELANRLHQRVQEQFVPVVDTVKSET